MLENATEIVVPLVRMNRYSNQSRYEMYIMSAEFYVILKKALSSYVLVYQKSKPQILTY